MFKEIKELLYNNVYKAFVEKSVPTANNVLGVRLPILRKIATKISNEDVMISLKTIPAYLMRIECLWEL